MLRVHGLKGCLVCHLGHLQSARAHLKLSRAGSLGAFQVPQEDEWRERWKEIKAPREREREKREREREREVGVGGKGRVGLGQKV